MSEAAETLMHVDLCHAYCWVVRQPNGEVVLTFDEREGSDLRLHGRFRRESGGRCERCCALRAGAKVRHITRQIEYPDEPRTAYWTVLAVIGEMDEGGERP